jgi:FkbM family methyltransferase
MNNIMVQRKKSATFAINFFKKVPGLVFTLAWTSSISRKAVVFIVKEIVLLFTSTKRGRSLVFEALTDQLVLANHPAEKYIVSTNDQIIGQKIYTRGSFDFQKFEVAISIIHAHGKIMSPAILIDIGANIGSIAIPALRRGYVERCIAFELDPLNARLLSANAFINEVEHMIDIRNLAVGNDTEDVAIQYSSSNFGDHRVLHKIDDNDTTKVGMIRLNSIFDELEICKTILWMDIQGYEAYALQGASEFIKAGVPLITEFAPNELRSFNSLDLFINTIINSSYKILVDLNAPIPHLVPLSEENLRELLINLDNKGDFTDLLFLD